MSQLLIQVIPALIFPHQREPQLVRATQDHLAFAVAQFVTLGVDSFENIRQKCHRFSPLSS
jgi:branched-subunit amino acid transport protein AzlD